MGAVAVDRGLEGLFQDEYQAMFRLAFAVLGSYADAEEVVQDAFVAVAQRWEQIDRPGGYLRMTVVNGARKRQGRRRPISTITDKPSGADPAGGVDLLDLVDDLPERERTAIILRYYAQWSTGEIAEALGCPAGTVRSLLHRTLTTLRGRLHHD